MIKRTVLVTGISGFVGQHCAAELLRKGYRVRGSVRSMKKAESVRQGLQSAAPVEHLEFVELDLLEEAGWEEAMEGCTYVLHVASPFVIAEPSDENELIKPAVDGTLRALRTADKAGVKRVVVTSSILAMSAHMTRGEFDHDSWTDIHSGGVSAYTKSKTLAERAAWEFAEKDTCSIELAVVNPGAVLGPTLTGNLSGQSMTMVSDMLQGKLPMIPDLSVPLVDVRDVATLHVRAMEEEQAAGKRFIAASAKAIPYMEVAKILKSNGYSKVSTRRAPTALIWLASFVSRDAKGMLTMLGRCVDADIQRTVETLQWRPMSLEQTVLDMAKSVDTALREQ